MPFGVTGSPSPVVGAVAVFVGICETMNGNWSQLDMTTRLPASHTQASLALAVFWAMVTAGRVLFGAIDRWLPERITYHILPFVLVGTFLGVAFLTRPHAAAGIGVFALAGLGCSALLPLTISFGEGDLTALAAAMAGGVIAFYQLGYGIAAFGVGPPPGRRHEPVGDLRLHRRHRGRDGAAVLLRHPPPAGSRRTFRRLFRQGWCLKQRSNEASMTATET
jgi:hypothetical protein